MENIQKYFKNIFDISDKDWDFISQRFCIYECKKKTTLLNAGDIENYISFIETGIVRYFIPKDENEITIGFNFKDEFASAYDSFLTKTPSPYQIETLEKTRLWRISYNDLQDIYRTTDIGNVIGRIASEELFKKKSKRLISLLNKTAEQRYLDLLREQPHIIRLVPLKYISSYIGVTPQALSRIRRRIC